MSLCKVAIVMGSRSDAELGQKAEAELKGFGILSETFVISAHRNPNKIKKFGKTLESNGFGVVIAIAGLAAHLPGVVASLTVLPVIGLPVETGPLGGQDALYSIVQMPPGIPVATVGIGNAKNAALLAAQIISVGVPALRTKMVEYRKQFGDDLD
jgi:5-(carboxyamino)imidazole ribonucleotide mutase